MSRLLSITLMTAITLLLIIATQADFSGLFAFARTDVFDFSPTQRQKDLTIGEEKFAGNTPTPRGATQPTSSDSQTETQRDQSGTRDDQTETAPPQTGQERTPTRGQTVPTGGAPQPVPLTSLNTCPLGQKLAVNQSCNCSHTLTIRCVGDNATEGIQRSYLSESTTGTSSHDNGAYSVIPDSEYEAKRNQADCDEYCIGKPVIYLYPEEPLIVDVRVEFPGYVYASDPLYPEGGWKDVFALPDGTLYYQGEEYRDLFYETSIEGGIQAPDNGILIPREDLAERLLEYTRRLGLSEFESSEFNEYWVPHLTALDAPYFLFSILDEEEKQRVDAVYITPEPDTFINFIAYFEPVYEWYEPKPLTLPEQPPARIGFTAVEWGGTVGTTEEKN